jgi:phage terminase large subunit-like protein
VPPIASADARPSKPTALAFRSDGHRAIRFIEAFCRYTKGPQAGALIVLRPWQRKLILELYRLDANGRRVYRRGLWGVARKNGKTMIGAGLALFSLIADETYGAEVYSVAGDRDQARICFDEAVAMVKLEPELRAVCIVRDAQATILHPSSGSSYRALAADSATAEGYNPSFVVFDEVHVQPNAKLWAVMVNGSGTREKAMVLGITTAGFNLNTLCGSLYKMGRRGSVAGFMFAWFEPANPNSNWLDERVWYEANPGLGDFQMLDDFRASAAEAQARGAENEFRRYRLNQWTGSVAAWLPFGKWSALADHDNPLIEGESVVLGFDGSFSGDSTAIVACAYDREVPYLEVIRLWEKPEGDADWRVPISDVEDAITVACKTFNVLEVACDPYRWQRSMQVLQEAGVPIVEYLTTSPARMVRATTIFSDAVRDGTLRHDGDPDLARHIGNAVIKTDAKGPRIVKESKMSSLHIDLAIAAIIALDRALDQVVDEGAFGDGGIY